MRPKPQTRDAVRHREGYQPWSPANAASARAVVGEVSKRIGVDWEMHYPDAGEYLLISEVPRPLEEQAKGLALALSRAFPQHWLVSGRVFVRGGKFYRRKRGYRLELILATNVHLNRAIRNHLCDLI